MTSAYLALAAGVIVAAVVAVYLYRVAPRSSVRIRSREGELVARGRYIRARAILVMNTDLGLVYRVVLRRRHQPDETHFLPPAEAVARRWIIQNDTPRGH